MPTHPVWYAPPQPGDIVQCWFPQDKFAAPGPKSRPALVLRVDEFDVAGKLQADVTIAFGTSTLGVWAAERVEAKIDPSEDSF